MRSNKTTTKAEEEVNFALGRVAAIQHARHPPSFVSAIFVAGQSGDTL